MYCPNCNQEFDSKFCPECGTKLIEKSRQELMLEENSGEMMLEESSSEMLLEETSNAQVMLEEKVVAKSKYKTEAENKYLSDAKKGNAEAQYNLAECYANGSLGLKEDKDKAIKWLTKAADAGHAEAQYILAESYLKGKFRGKGIRANKIKAEYLYNQAAENGNIKAQLFLAEFYRISNSQKAFYWYSKTAEAGYAESQYRLGSLYEYGQGVQSDSKKAAFWYQKAAEQGHGHAQYELGICYRDGFGVEMDRTKAIYWMSKAADQNVPDAKKRLKDLTTTDEERETKLKKLIADANSGIAKAQWILGNCYSSGKLGLKQDYYEASKWYDKARAQGYYSSVIDYDYDP